MAWRVLTWNLFHGRAVPPAGRDLLHEFTATLGAWEWDLALLQEVPPWWPAPLASALHADQRSVLTSRNAGLAARRAIAVRWPDLIKSNGGGCNAILVRRSAGSISEHRARRLSLRPEQRWVHGVRVAGAWICNVHTEADHGQARLAASTALAWADSLPVVLGGDLNLRSPTLDGFTPAGGHGVDHVFVRGFEVAGEAEVLDHGALSDHAPVCVTVRPPPRRAESAGP